MQPTIKDVLIEILTIAGYPNDKEKFIKEFEALNILEAILSVYKELPPDQQELVKANSDNPHILQKHIPQEAYKSALMHVTGRAIQDLVHNVAPMLSFEQKEKLNNIVL